MTAIATDTVKAVKAVHCSGRIMSVTVTTVFTFDMSSDTAGHGGQIAVTFFAVTRSGSGIAVSPDGLCGTESPIIQTGDGAIGGGSGVVAQDKIVRGARGVINVGTVTDQAADRLSGVTVRFVRVTSSTGC